MYNWKVRIVRGMVGRLNIYKRKRSFNTITKTKANTIGKTTKENNNNNNNNNIRKEVFIRGNSKDDK